MTLDNLIVQEENLTICRLHRAAPLSDGGIASYPPLHQNSSSTSPLIPARLPPVTILSKYHPTHLIQNITCPKFIPVIHQDRADLKAEAKTSTGVILQNSNPAPTLGRSKHMEGVQQQQPCCFRNRICRTDSVSDRNISCYRGVSSLQELSSCEQTNWQAIFAQPLKRGRLHWVGSPLSWGAPL